MSQEPSKYQLAIYDCYKNTNKNIFISAGPGSGKSHTILEMLKQTPFHKKAILTAFNKSIADELGTKVPIGTEVSTIHSLGFKVMRKNLFGKFKVMQESNIKTYILAKDVIENPFKDVKNGQKRYAVYLFTIAKLYDLYRLNLADKTESALQLLADEYSVELIGENILADSIKVIDKLQDYNSKQHKEIMIDFTDMLWFPYTFVDAEMFPKYDVVFIDEVQDTPALQRELMLRLRKQTGRFVVVGDEKQAIYSFMGANLNSLKIFQNMPNTEVLPLSISYRFGKNIAEYANKIFPGSVEGFDQNPDGIIREGTLLEVEVGDFVICRNNMPLMEAFLKLITNDKSSYIMGKDFGRELCNLIDSVDSVEEFDDVLEKKIKDLESHGNQRPTEHKSYVMLDEKIRIIKMVMLYKDYSLYQTKDLFDKLFSDKEDKSKVTLTTIHKSKGLQARRVFWLEPELIPSKYARTELEVYAELCLKFVVVTRCKEELIIVKQNNKY